MRRNFLVIESFIKRKEKKMNKLLWKVSYFSEECRR